MNSNSLTNAWRNRVVDLSAYAGKIISSIAGLADQNTAAGSWAIYYSDIAIVSSDGAVLSVYNGESSYGFSAAWGSSSGVTGRSASVNHEPGAASAVCCEGLSTTYYHEDHLGSSRLVSSGQGWPVWSGTFLPFGQDGNPQITANHYKFTGKERDSESNLDYFGARYFSSAMGRWLSPDWSRDPDPLPWADIENPQTLNLYGYVINNPLARRDSDGHHQVCGAETSFTDSKGVVRVNANCVEVPDILFAAVAVGHHFIPREIFDNLDLRQGSFQYKLLKNFTSGKLEIPKVNYFDKLHRAYNKAIQRLIERYEARTGRALRDFQEGDFRAVTEEIKGAGGDTEAFLTRLSDANPEARTLIEGLENAIESVRSSSVGEAVGEAAEACEAGGCIPF
jgi:RHS repeat-associated protein